MNHRQVLNYNISIFYLDSLQLQEQTTIKTTSLQVRKKKLISKKRMCLLFEITRQVVSVVTVTMFYESLVLTI